MSIILTINGVFYKNFLITFVNYHKNTLYYICNSQIRRLYSYKSKQPKIAQNRRSPS